MLWGSHVSKWGLSGYERKHLWGVGDTRAFAAIVVAALQWKLPRMGPGKWLEMCVDSALGVRRRLGWLGE